ncbi:MAG: tRNA (guanosine(46)-N7)-methyltransferase TrmB [Burkholderiaceae bacterium]
MTQLPFGHIKSFVRRQGKITAGQRLAREQLLSRWAIAFEPAPIVFTDLFGRSAPTTLEIGFGMGETTARMAQAMPERNFLGLEVYPAGVGALLKRIENEGITNIRIMEHDAVEVLEHCIPDASLESVHIYFPDPWPKARHHKRRLIQPPFVNQLAPKLRVGGLLHCATDWAPYGEQMLEVLGSCAALRNLSPAGYAPKPDWRPLTKFESRGLRLGHPVVDLLFERC